MSVRSLSGLAALVVLAALGTALGYSSAPAGARAAAPSGPQQRISILGDSVMVDGQPGVEAVLDSTGAAQAYRHAFVGYGITRDNWPVDYGRVLAQDNPTAVVMMIGDWDNVFAAKHPRQYASTVGKVMDFLTHKGAFLLWIGMEPGDPRFVSEARRRNLNSIVQAEAAKRPKTVSYLPSEPIFDGPDGKYAMFLPGPDGKSVRIRKVDGLHICPDGAVRLGQAVYDALQSRLQLPPPAPNWQSGSWRQDPVYTASTTFDHKTLKLTHDPCPAS